MMRRDAPAAFETGERLGRWAASTTSRSIGSGRVLRGWAAVLGAPETAAEMRERRTPTAAGA
jgi:hypothetical protein